MVIFFSVSCAGLYISSGLFGSLYQVFLVSYEVVTATVPRINEMSVVMMSVSIVFA